MGEHIVCDTCVFIALWKEDDPARQQIFSKTLFEKIEKDEGYCVLFTDLNQSEIRNKHPVYENSYIGLQTKLCDLSKGEVVLIKEISQKEKKEIFEIQEQAEKLDFPGLSFADCLFFLIAKKRGAKLVTWEHTLYDFVKESGFEDVYYPDELISFE